MPPWAIDLICVVLILGVTYALSSEGAWGATLMFFDVMFSGLIAFNFHETLAGLLAENAPAMAGWADFLCLMGVFVVCLITMRIATDSIAPAMIRLPKPVYHLGRLGFGFATGAMLVGILLSALQTAPVHRRILGSIVYNTKPPFGQGLDRRWLAFVQYTTENSFPRFIEEKTSAEMFDPRGSWLIDHQNARPFIKEGGSQETVPPAEAPAPQPAPEG